MEEPKISSNRYLFIYRSLRLRKKIIYPNLQCSSVLPSCLKPIGGSPWILGEQILYMVPESPLELDLASRLSPDCTSSCSLLWAHRLSLDSSGAMVPCLGTLIFISPFSTQPKHHCLKEAFPNPQIQADCLLGICSSSIALIRVLIFVFGYDSNVFFLHKQHAWGQGGGHVCLLTFMSQELFIYVLIYFKIIYFDPISQTCMHVCKYHGLSTCHTFCFGENARSRPSRNNRGVSWQKAGQNALFTSPSTALANLCLASGRSSLNVCLLLLKSKKIKATSQASLRVYWRR